MKRLIVAIFIIASLLILNFLVLSPKKSGSLKVPNMPEVTPIKFSLDSEKIFNLVNDYRTSHGLNALVYNPQVCQYASKRLDEIQTDFSHNGFWNNFPSYKNPQSYIGENLIKGYYSSDQQVVKDWIASPEHLSNIMNRSYTQTCVETQTDPLTVPLSFAVQEFSSTF